MNELNEGRVKRFSDGGSAGGATASASNSAEGQEFSINIINIADSASIPKMTGPEIINHVSFNLSKKDVLYKQVKGIVKGD